MANNRDYKKEYEHRKKKNARLFADMDRELVEEFKRFLQWQNITYSEWLQSKIKEELNRVKGR